MGYTMPMASEERSLIQYCGAFVLAGTAEQEFELVEYDLDSEDERWLQDLNNGQVINMVGASGVLHLSNTTLHPLFPASRSSSPGTIAQGETRDDALEARDTQCSCYR